MDPYAAPLPPPPGAPAPPPPGSCPPEAIGAEIEPLAAPRIDCSMDRPGESFGKINPLGLGCGSPGLSSFNGARGADALGVGAAGGELLRVAAGAPGDSLVTRSVARAPASAV